MSINGCSYKDCPRTDVVQVHLGHYNFAYLCPEHLPLLRPDPLPETTDPPRNNLTYEQALHGIQSGVAIEMERNQNSSHTPKHLRVGVNSALVNDAALVRLLVAKGVMTFEEYMEELRLEANRELDRYEDRLREELKNPNLSLR